MRTYRKHDDVHIFKQVALVQESVVFPWGLLWSCGPLSCLKQLGCLDGFCNVFICELDMVRSANLFPFSSPFQVQNGIEFGRLNHL